LDSVWFSFPIAETISFVIMMIWLTAAIKDSMSNMRAAEASDEDD
jgi:hypothetical protein